MNARQPEVARTMQASDRQWLDAHWMPFTGNREFKANPRMLTGAEGAYYDSDVAGTGRVDGFPVKEIVDTVGAGDGFAAGVVSALLEGKSVPEAVHRGAWIGARAVQVLGDTEGLPTRAQLEEARL